MPVCGGRMFLGSYKHLYHQSVCTALKGFLGLWSYAGWYSCNILFVLPSATLLTHFWDGEMFDFAQPHSPNKCHGCVWFAHLGTLSSSYRLQWMVSRGLWSPVRWSTCAGSSLSSGIKSTTSWIAWSPPQSLAWLLQHRTVVSTPIHMHTVTC